MTYILIVVTYVYVGTNVTMQEFSSLDRCEAALSIVRDKGRPFVKHVECVKK